MLADHVLYCCLHVYRISSSHQLTVFGKSESGTNISEHETEQAPSCDLWIT